MPVFSVLSSQAKQWALPRLAVQFAAHVRHVLRHFDSGRLAVFVRCSATLLVLIAIGIPAIVGCQDLQSGASNIYQRTKIAVAGDEAQQQAAASATAAPTKGSG